MARGQPRFDASYQPTPHALAEGLHAIERRFFMPGGPTIPTRSFAVEVAPGALAVLSPPPDAAARRAVERLGQVRFLIAPNSFHYVGLPSWASAFPEAQRYLAPGLRTRRPELPAGIELGDAVTTPFADVLPHVVLDCGRGVTEVAFLHRPSRTLILTDACFHILDARRRDRLAWRLLGAWRRFGPSRTARLILLRDPARVAEFVERLCRLDFSRVAVAHGALLEPASAETLRAAFRPYLA